MPSISEFKKTFFDPNAVLDPAVRVMRQKLSRYGAFVRTRAKSSIKKRKKPADPGKPPSSHAGTLKRLIFFGFEPSTQTVVVGPAKFENRHNYVVPEVLEKSGTVVVVKPGKKPQAAHYRGNPFMQPAHEAELPKFMESLKDSITPNA